MPNNTARLEMALILQVDLEDGSQLEYSVANTSETFAINNIPVARCTLAVGRDAFSLRAATVHSQKSVNGLRMLNRARIIFRPHGEWQPTDVGVLGDGKWTKAGTRVIFDGYLTGFGSRHPWGTRGPVRVPASPTGAQTQRDSHVLGDGAGRNSNRR